MPLLIAPMEEGSCTPKDKAMVNFRLEFASNLASGFLNGDTAAASSPSGISILGPVDVLVIDRVERASPN